jgi:very-short-patch-repair endonuclease
MHKPQNASLSKILRLNQTDAETKLWRVIRNRQLDGIKFRRQRPVGNYIVDFISLDRMLIIEIDGGHHNEDSIKEKDQQRQTWLENQGYRVIRFWDNEVLQNLEGVILKIRESLGMDNNLT